jgi:hypothetical protein
VGSWRGFPEAAFNLAYSADGGFLAAAGGDPGGKTGAGGGVTVWEARTGRVVRVLRDPAANVYGVAFTPDGRPVASARGVR